MEFFMKGYFCSIIDCSKNHDEKLKNIDLRLIQVFSKRNWSITISSRFF